MMLLVAALIIKFFYHLPKSQDLIVRSTFVVLKNVSAQKSWVFKLQTSLVIISTQWTHQKSTFYFSSNKKSSLQLHGCEIKA